MDRSLKNKTLFSKIQSEVPMRAGGGGRGKEVVNIIPH